MLFSCIDHKVNGVFFFSCLSLLHSLHFLHICSHTKTQSHWGCVRTEKAPLFHPRAESWLSISLRWYNEMNKANTFTSYTLVMRRHDLYYNKQGVFHPEDSTYLGRIISKMDRLKIRSLRKRCKFTELKEKVHRTAMGVMNRHLR